MTKRLHRAAFTVLFSAALLHGTRAAAEIAGTVSHAIQPVMDRYHIPGMAVGVVQNGSMRVCNFGVASRATGRKVSDDTLFEIGSVSKTLTITLASLAALSGQLSFSDTASVYLPDLRGSAFDKITLLQLATHTAGGLPLQVPDEIHTDDQLMRYLRDWKPRYAPGTQRLYSNVSIGLLGMISARSMNGAFATLMRENIFAPLGMAHTFLSVPANEMKNYAQGYTKTDVPIRMAPGVLAEEAYGIRTTASDMLRFVMANMQLLKIDGKLQRAIRNTHESCFHVGPMTQDLIWEQYPEGVTLKDLLAGNSAAFAMAAHPATRIDPPLRPSEDVLINKTGSTNGFAAYVAFVPGKKVGVVLLANKNFPMEARVGAAWEILRGLAGENGEQK